MSRFTLLYVDSNPTTRKQVTTALKEAGPFDIHAVNSLEEARHRLDTKDIDAVVTRYELSDGTCFDLFGALAEDRPEIALFLYADISTEEIDTERFPDLVIDYYDRDDTTPEELSEALEIALTYRTQAAYPVPNDESERLAALAEYDVGNLDAETAFDSLTRLAADVFDTPVAFVGLIREHEEQFVSCHGIDWGVLTREDTVCTYGIVEGGVLSIEDFEADSRFSANEVLAEAGLRSYLGAPLVTPAGSVIGTFCVLDDEPRIYTEAERTRVRLFADQAMNQLELRRRYVTNGE